MASIIESIEVEAEAFVSGRDLSAHAKPSYIAVCEYVRGLPVDVLQFSGVRDEARLIYDINSYFIRHAFGRIGDIGM